LFCNIRFQLNSCQLQIFFYKIYLHTGIKVTICWRIYYFVGLSGKCIVVTFCSNAPFDAVFTFLHLWNEK
jgi:hypothetical protein